MSEILVALVTATGVIGAAAVPILLQQRKLNETHRMLTVNHHSSEKRGQEPTVLDRIDDVKQLLLEHIKHADDDRDRLSRLEDHVYRK